MTDNKDLNALLQRVCPVCGSPVPRMATDHPSDYAARSYCSRSCGSKASNARNLEPLEDRIARLTRRNEATGCLDWIGPLKKDGYGAITVGNVPDRTHRVAYRLWVGPIPEGMLVCHKCDNRRCMEPGHFFLGTNADNTADRNSKGRQAKGSANGRTHLVEGDVVEIIGATGTYASIASRFGIGETTVHNIKSGKTWQHVPRLSALISGSQP